jgi:hypothetical protein
MRTELVVFPFLSALSLSTLVPFCSKFHNAPFFFLVAWLLLCNIIQGVNVIVSANNVSNYMLVWCDIGISPLILSVTCCLIIGSNSNYTRCTSGFAGCNIMSMLPTTGHVIVLEYHPRCSVYIPYIHFSVYNVPFRPHTIYSVACVFLSFYLSLYSFPIYRHHSTIPAFYNYRGFRM